VDRPVSREIDLEVIFEVVLGARWIALAPASWCWPGPAKAIDSTSPWARSPLRMMAGYFIVSLEPMLPSTHSTTASSVGDRPLGDQVKMLLAQFWIVV